MAEDGLPGTEGSQGHVSRLCSASSNQDIVTTSVVNDDSRENMVDSMGDIGGSNDHDDDSNLPSLEDILSQAGAMAPTTIPHSDRQMGHNVISESGRFVGNRTDMQGRGPNIGNRAGSGLGSSQGEHTGYPICFIVRVRTFGSHDRCRLPYRPGRPGRRQQRQGPARYRARCSCIPCQVQTVKRNGTVTGSFPNR
jgi:hypothetical protein